MLIPKKERCRCNSNLEKCRGYEKYKLNSGVPLLNALVKTCPCKPVIEKQRWNIRQTGRRKFIHSRVKTVMQHS